MSSKSGLVVSMWIYNTSLRRLNPILHRLIHYVYLLSLIDFILFLHVYFDVTSINLSIPTKHDTLF